MRAMSLGKTILMPAARQRSRPGRPVSLAVTDARRLWAASEGMSEDATVSTRAVRPARERCSPLVVDPAGV